MQTIFGHALTLRTGLSIHRFGGSSLPVGIDAQTDRELLSGVLFPRGLPRFPCPRSSARRRALPTNGSNVQSEHDVYPRCRGREKVKSLKNADAGSFLFREPGDPFTE